MFRMMLVTMLLLLTAVAPAAAQETWFAYVYNGVEKQLVRVNLDGTTTSYDLGLPEDAYTGGYDMTFTPDGQRVIFCVTVTGQQSPGTATLYVRDIAAETTTTQLELGPTLGCRTGRQALSPDNRTVAVGMVRYFPGDTTADTSMPIWSLLLIDVNSGEIVQELNADMPAASAITTTNAMLPWVNQYDAGQVIFAEVPYATGGAPSYAAYAWDTTANTISPAPAHFGIASLKHLPATGEYIWPGLDESRPFTEPMGPMPTANVVQMLDASGERAIYATEDRIVSDLAFINQGQHIAIMIQPPLEPGTPNPPPLPWVALDRQGAVTPLTEVQSFSQMADAPGGYVLLRLEADENFANIQYSLEHTVIDGETSLLWLAEGQGWELAWAQPVAAAADLPAFPPAP